MAAQEIGGVAGDSVSLAERAGDLLNTIVPAIQKTSDPVQEIAAASGEQSAGLSQINTAINELNRSTQQNASASEELAATAEELSGQAQQLQQAIAFFRVESHGISQQIDRIARPDEKPARRRMSSPPVTSYSGDAGDSGGNDEANFVRF